eukprot:gene6292-12737_t
MRKNISVAEISQTRMMTLGFITRFHLSKYTTGLTNKFLARNKYFVTTNRGDNDVDDDIGGIDCDTNSTTYHVPVMLDECLNNLMTVPNGLYIDCTLGGGGHTREILKRGGRVIGLDQDPDAIAETSNKLNEYIKNGQLEIIQRNFRQISSALRDSKLANGQPLDGILLDLGVSSYQINNPLRGFAFGSEGPLDMRMEKTGRGLTASDIVNTWDATKLANLLFDLGEEPRSRPLAKQIIACRPLNTTKDLADAISKITFFKHRTKTLARCFQALRIAVNDELGALDEVLTAAEHCVRPGGRLVVLSYHSLEDRRVKYLMKTGAVRTYDDNTVVTIPSPFSSPQDSLSNLSPWNMLSKGAIGPSKEEIAINRRARSAKLRVAERIMINENSTAEDIMLSRSNSKYKRGMIGEKERKKRAGSIVSNE